MKNLLLIILLFMSSIQGQTENLKIVKIIDANLFELENGQLIRMKGIDVPSIADENDQLRFFALKAKKYAEYHIKNKNFEIPSNTLDSEKIYKSYFIKKYRDDSWDLRLEYIKNGYSRVNYDLESSNSKVFEYYQNLAKESSKGIWCIDGIENNLLISKEYDREDIITRLQKYPNIEEEKINLPKPEGSFLGRFFALTLGGVTGAAIGGKIGFAIDDYNLGPTFYGIIIGTFVGASLGIYLYSKVYDNNLSYSFNNIQVESEFFNITHQDIYNNSKIFDVNLLRINF